MADVRKKLRSSTVGKKKDLKKKTVEYEGEEFEIRQPTVALRAKIMQEARIQPESGEESDVESVIAKVDYSSMQVWSVIYCTYVPGEDERVFEPQDVQSLKDQPTGSFVDLFAEAAIELMNVTPEQAAKNSGQTDQSS